MYFYLREHFCSADIDHDRNLIALLDKCSEYELRLSAKKLQFKTSSVTFMGHKLTRKGVEPDPSKVAAIKEMRRPTDAEPQFNVFWARVSISANFVGTFLKPSYPLGSLYGLTRMKTRSTQQRNLLPQQLSCDTMIRLFL